MRSFEIKHPVPVASIRWLSVAFAGAVVAACGGGSGGGGGPGPGTPPAEAKLACDDTMKSRFTPDDQTKVLLVRAFKQGDTLALPGGTQPGTPVVASADVCMVKLLVGPGNPGPEDAPSTSAGIGIEVWLPTQDRWNKRIHAKGGGGWAGGAHTSLTVLAGTSGGSSGAPATTAMVEGAVSASTDTGHANTANGGSFAMKPDGTPNTVLWNDFSQRAIHEMADKTKALTRQYYGEPAKYAYFNGFSTGGRQGHKLAQVYPKDFDGILAGAPAINWTKFITGELYPQVVYQRDLAGVPLTSAQLTAMGNAAINACDVVGGQHLGYITDPMSCRYDPSLDATVLCVSDGGTGPAASCVTKVQAQAMNKIWYGQTTDGSVPFPATDIGMGPMLASNQRWFGLTRGTNMLGLAGPTPFPIATDLVALELQDASYAQPNFINAVSNGMDKWKTLTYANLSNAADQGLALQSTFANINTDDPNLNEFALRGGKMLVYHGMADTLIPIQGTLNYYERLNAQIANDPVSPLILKNYYRLFLVPGMAHGFSNGTTNTAASLPLPTNDQLYAALTGWVEQGNSPERLEIQTPASAPTKASGLLCSHPAKPVYQGTDPRVATSYACQ
ncbi:tannase/feruloyl esterase family alpha/beta hydrolase [Variovorax dokdonensis]|uniref:Tannase/feruloyl esterase family alpha/beta hydrolase n=1 Tax=Variovorax dokdonensis TaxID=344883 RepID=A0ABT7NDL0_9BURK|nr:tannase/feruloyl esterase family alpha/beta hydrolase [Variovorax dokdonensis]MDM0045940.1 tannase/feruloyl esterase family alpha/beta hydrolase [Variovorax dokdonensis]